MSAWHWCVPSLKADLAMSDLKDSAARSQTAAPSGLSGKPEINSTLPTASPALNTAPYQGGYLSKLFGFGSGTGPSATDRPHGAMDEAHEYHPGNLRWLTTDECDAGGYSLTLPPDCVL